MSDYLNFTLQSEDKFYDTVDTQSFADEDAESIYRHLNEYMKLIPFGDYLKRYIFRKAGFDGNYGDIDIKDYQYIIMDSFAENYAPNSFTPTSSKLSALAKNWLTSSSVSRKTVFLLGFGLNMDVDDVSEFLVHAQLEHDFNFKNPFEIICWYCYKNHYKFAKFSQLYEEFEALPVNKDYANLDATISIRDLFFKVNTEEDLMKKLAEIKTENEGCLFSVTARKYFDELYYQTREIIAAEYNEDAEFSGQRDANDYLESMSRSDKLSDEEKSERASKIRSSVKKYTADDITNADVEKFLCCGIPFDGKGNLLKLSNSTLAKHFNNKRMSRKHLQDILSGKSDVDRFDLITLSFFIRAMDENESNNKRRYSRFLDDTNKMLRDCYMSDIYITNPYECFLLMCILSDWPMGAYSDVLELSFDEESR